MSHPDQLRLGLGDRTVVLVGDSKAAQWFSPMKQIAEESGWRMVFIAKGACEFADVVRPIDGQANEACDDWSQWALDEVLAEDVDVVVTVTRWGQALRPGDDLSTGQSREAMVEGLVAHWNAVAPPEHRDAFVWVVTRHEIDYRGNLSEGETVSDSPELSKPA